MKKITKADQARLDEVSAALQTKAKKLEDAVTLYNAKLAELFAPVQAAVDEFNTELNAAREFRDEVVQRMDDYASDKSDKWSESESGENFASWKSQWEELELDDLEVEEPDEYALDTDPDDRITCFNDLPTECD